MEHEHKPPDKYTNSDKLGIVLACLAGIMAIVLFLVEKTPATIVVSLFTILALSVYPIVHFLKRLTFRILAACLVLVGTTAFGLYVWPKQRPGEQQATTKPPLLESAQANPLPAGSTPVKSSPKSEQAKPRKRVPGSNPTTDNSVHIANGSNIEQTSTGDCSPNIVGGSSTVNCGPPPAKITHWEQKPAQWQESEGLIDESQVTMTTDRSMEVPAFLVKCDRPCHVRDAVVFGAYNKVDYLTTPDNTVSGAVFLSPRP